MRDNFAQAPVSIAEKRAQIEGHAAKWTPRDALINTLRSIDSGELQGYEVGVIILGKIESDGRSCVHYAIASPSTLHTMGAIERAKHILNRATGDE